MPVAPLAGFTVGVTADRRWEEQAELLRRRGAAVLHGPTIDTLYLADDHDLKVATAAVVDERPDYVVATTGIGMRAWLEAAAAWGLGAGLVDALRGARIVARGPKAAGAVTAAGLEVWARSGTERMDDVLAKLLSAGMEGRRVAVQEYGAESPDLAAALTGAGAAVLPVPVYRWRLPADPAPALGLVEAACDGRVDAVTFTSAPAVHNLFAIAATRGLDADLRRAFNRSVVAACVGPVCAEGARREGVVQPLQPEIGRLGLLVRTLSDHMARHRRCFLVDGHELVVQGSAVCVDGNVAVLSARERALFDRLTARPGTVVDRATLLTEIWGSPRTDPHLLEVTAGRLRRRLGPCGPAVSAKSGRGYRFLADDLA